jgi:uncharacterized lipoprotein YddW (UPF0748 family)
VTPAPARTAAVLAAVVTLLTGCGTGVGPGAIRPGAAAPAGAPALAAHELPPPEPREFRAAWIATVANIDWPSAPGLSAAQQRSEALAILDRAQALGLNALVLQVRPAGDAIYPSTLEPWTEYLGGAQGRAPWRAGEAAWDPLAFWLEQARRRGLELHAWFNPYRARHSAAKSPLAPPHLGLREPGLVKTYDDMLWMDPGEPAAAAHTLAVVADVLRRYDLDGVHIDDYFYPYPAPLPGQPPPPPGSAPAVELPFPDDPSYTRYLAGGGSLARDDWRRDNVDRLVQALQRTVREVRPLARVGISPFGLGRPERRPPGVVGFSQYDKLYADVEKWFHAGWLDYLAPQLYWPIDRAGQAFPLLLDTWINENLARRHLWPGLFTSQVVHSAAGQALGPRAWPARELLDQVQQVRARAAPGNDVSVAANPGSTGHIHFSMAALMQDRDGVASALRAGPYAQPALVPATPWLDSQPPPAPLLRLAARTATIVPGTGEPAARWAVWRRVGGQWRFSVQPAQELQVDLAGADALVVSAVDRVGNVGPRNALRLGAGP